MILREDEDEVLDQYEAWVPSAPEAGWDCLGWHSRQSRCVALDTACMHALLALRSKQATGDVSY